MSGAQAAVRRDATWQGGRDTSKQGKMLEEKPRLYSTWERRRKEASSVSAGGLQDTEWEPSNPFDPERQWESPRLPSRARAELSGTRVCRGARELIGEHMEQTT